MKKIIIIVLCAILMSCTNENIIYYEYEGVTITRLDRDNQIYFYYGKFENGVYPQSYIKAEYSGFNSGMHAYLTFLPNKKVDVIDVMAYFEKIGNEPNFNIIEVENEIFIPWLDSLYGNYNNTVEVLDIIDTEQERNKRNNSKVKATYP